jgi:flagellar biosynthetic protein FliQ
MQMGADQAIELARHALLLALLLAAPVLAIALLTSLITSVLQTITQLHDQSLSFIPRLIAVVLVVLVTLPWGLSLLTEYTAELFQNIPSSVSLNDPQLPTSMRTAELPSNRPSTPGATRRLAFTFADSFLSDPDSRGPFKV